MQPPLQPRPSAAAVILSSSIVIGIFGLQALLLSIGIHRDYQLKHEDNNALHATFARSHLQLGLATTRGQNYFYSPTRGSGSFYPNHPPGPGLVLAVVYGLTGHDGHVITRAAAMAFHVLGTWLFYGLARRTLKQQWEVVLALLVYVVVPESAFFGRMMNHEVLVLPATILLVRGYWESVHGVWSRPRWVAAIVVGATCAAVSGWAGFFAVGACVVHAAWELAVRRNPRARLPLVLLALAGGGLFVSVLAHLVWVSGADVSYLEELLAARMGTTEGSGPANRIGRILELHWRYFGLTSAAALGAIVVRALRKPTGAALDPAQEVGMIFLLAGAGYVAAFNFNATKHDYWQFLLLPASALGIVLMVRSLLATATRQGRPLMRRLVLGLVVFDLAGITTVTLVQRHVKREGYCIRVVQELRRDQL